MTTLAKAHFAVAPVADLPNGRRITVRKYGIVSTYSPSGYVDNETPVCVVVSMYVDDETYDRAATLAEQRDIPLIVYEEDIPF